MDALQRFVSILLADLRERTRSPRFWVVLLGMMAATWWCFPPIDAGYTTVSLAGAERGQYSSAWIGMVLAMEFSTLLSLGGFYLVRGTLVRDIDTRVWQLLVATPMTRGGYLLAKWASHMAIFGVIVGAGLAVGVVAQIVRAEDLAFDWLELVKPSLLLSLPGLAVTAMFAVWFDLLPWLRKTAGNVLFFVLWSVLTSVSLSQLDIGDAGWRSDPNGMVVIARDLHRVREQQTGQPQKIGFSVGMQRNEKAPDLFQWQAWPVRAKDVFGRGLWLLAALGGVLMAAPLLDWAAARGSSTSRGSSGAGLRLRWLDPLLDPFARHPVGVLAVAEMKLALRQRRVWWWLAALVALVLQAFAPAKGFQVGMLLAWVLPLDILARGLLREKQHGTGAMVFSAPNILRRLLAARFGVCLLLLVGLTLPGLLRLAATTPLAAIAALAISVSIVSWGLCLGALCRDPRPFELLLVLAAYGGLQGAMLFDLNVAPQATAIWHALALLPAWLLLIPTWPRLARC